MKGTAGRLGDSGNGVAHGAAGGHPVAGHGARSGDPCTVAPPRTTAGPLSPAMASALAAELLRRADEDRELMRQTGVHPTPERERRIARCHRDNAEALAMIVRRYGWPNADLVGPPASTAALMILLHASDLGFRLRCRDLIAQDTADGRTPAIHLAYIADQCAVDLGQPQYYGTRIDPTSLRPYPIRHPQSVDERRRDVGLGPLEEQLQALRIHG
ncbi:DUF6624 domain-containing protein [Streptomyces sp. NBC_00005]|uniref:DUF6624 domain-containing protein n=1 Tax=Streptomyces sp. NBC_00005 TaxID=2903609 RepID=UPI00386A7F85